MRRLLSALLILMLFCPLPVSGEDSPSPDVILDEIILDDSSPDASDPSPSVPDTVFTPSLGSPWEQDLGSAYWTTPMDITNESAVWDMLMQPITVVDPGKKTTSKSQVYLYQEPDKSSRIIGEVTCKSQGVRVIQHLDNGWSLVECYSSSFHTPATKTQAWNLLVSGYIQTDYLSTVKPSKKFALVVDKLTQRVYVFQDGKLLSTLLCSTGLVQHNGSKYQPYNETRSGEFIFISQLGSYQSDKLICSYAIRFNGGDAIHEVPHVVQKDGTWNYKSTEPFLGQKRSHGCIRVQRNKTPEGINMKWIRNQADNDPIKIVIWEDWQGRQIPIPDPDTVLYYNPNKGQYYHRLDHCNNGKGKTFTPFSYSQLEDDGFSGLDCCPWCNPPMREADLREINETYAPGRDHEELLNTLRQNYWDYLSAGQ